MALNGQIKKYLGYYILWTFMHLIFLVLGWNGEYHEEFWPFSDDNYKNTINKAYDFSEFLVYVFGPIVLLVAFSFISSGNLESEIEKEMNRRKSNS